ncbi:Zinc finger protein [Trichinella sp. T6]|nr:Zinc finger protein [Trichinella sp. T6]
MSHVTQPARWTGYAVLAPRGSARGRNSASRARLFAMPTTASSYNAKRFPCKLCKTDYESEAELEFHIQEHENGKFVINIPPPPVLSELKEDSQETTNLDMDEGSFRGRRLRCNMCGERFQDRSLFGQHLADHENPEGSRTARKKVGESDSVPTLVKMEKSQDDVDEKEKVMSEPPSLLREQMGSPEDYFVEEEEDDDDDEEEEDDRDEEETYECKECHATFSSYRGLLTHTSRKHGNAAMNALRNKTLKTENIYDDYSEGMRDEFFSLLNAKNLAYKYAEIGDVPGAASTKDTEVFPCRQCPDRIFLTSYGLERHTRLTHPDKVKEVLQYIDDIERHKSMASNIGSVVDTPVIRARGRGRGRRGRGRSLTNTSSSRSLRYREDTPSPPIVLGDEYDEFSFPALPPYNPDEDSQGGKEEDTEYVYESSVSEDDLVQSRHSSTGRQRRSSTYSNRDFQIELDETGDMYQIVRQHSEAMVAAASFTESRAHGRPRRSNGTPKAKYQSCETCGILINTEHPRAMESHMKAHQKNMELRQELLRLYGNNWVDQVTCRECNLVFKDGDKLEQHRRNVHVKRRHFLCRFCGDVFRNMRDLNLHKERRHEAFEGHRRGADPNASMTFSYQRRGNNYEDSRSFYGTDASRVSDLPFIMTCAYCKTMFGRVGEYMQHMLEIHHRLDSVTTLDAKYFAPFKVDCYKGKVHFGCCDLILYDHNEMAVHRRTVHGSSASGRPKKCRYCPIVLMNTATYDRHIATHRFRKCTICHCSFGTSTADYTLYRSHMLKHREHGYDIPLSMIDDGINPTERDFLMAVNNEEECGDGSDDDYSVFSGSGVESNAEDEEDDENLITCFFCGKYFSCVGRSRVHMKLHLQKHLRGMKFKTAPFSGKLHNKLRCYLCGKVRYNRAAMAFHFIQCMRRRKGFIRTTEIDPPSVVLIKKEEGISAEPVLANIRLPTVTAGGALSMDGLDARCQQDGGNFKNPSFLNRSFLLTWKSVDDKPDSVEISCMLCAETFENFLQAAFHVKKVHIDNGKGGKVENVDRKLFEQNSGMLGMSTIKSNKQQSESASRNARVNNTTAVVFPIYGGLDRPKNQKKFRCFNCLMNFKTKQELERHKLTHRPKREYRCRICRQHFWTSKGLDRHLKLHDVNNMYCQICFKKFKTCEALQKHETCHELANSLYQCEDCNLSVCSMRQLNNHFMQSHCGISILTCMVCAAIHTDKRVLKQHIRSAHPDLVVRCVKCKKRFSCPFLVKRHFNRVHMYERTESCPSCGKIFFDKRSLTLHRWHHLSFSGRYQCMICDQLFDNIRQMQVHLKSSHSDIVVKDDGDNAIFVYDTEKIRRGYVQRGGDSVEVEYMSQCCFCVKAFANKAEAVNHLFLRHGFARQPPKCYACGAAFNFVKTLRAHLAARHGIYSTSNNTQDVEMTEIHNESVTGISEHEGSMLMGSMADVGYVNTFS